MTYNPASLVCLVVLTLVATFSAVTVAPGTTAPVGSVIVPWIDPPPPVWAITWVPAQKQTRSRGRIIFIDFIWFLLSEQGNRLTDNVCEVVRFEASKEVWLQGNEPSGRWTNGVC